MSGTSVS
ncbi:hypothetical protein F383_07057 [Gossypium arboreum]|nr:hypothetical protein F383_07057 [Gossypium arboreum]